MIYLVRHGLDDENYIGGWSDVPLITEGVEQVYKTKKFIDSNIKYDEIISSDVLRARQTAEILCGDKRIIYTDLLREQDKGKYNGKLKKELNPNNYFLGKINIWDHYPEGESMINLYDRINKLLNNIERWDGKLLVTHRGVINMMYYILNGIELDMNKDRFNVTHASVHKLNIKTKKIERIY